jgi:hypothetical protein
MGATLPAGSTDAGATVMPLAEICAGSRTMPWDPAPRCGSGQDLRRRGQAIPTHDLLLLQSPLGSPTFSASGVKGRR